MYAIARQVSDRFITASHFHLPTALRLGGVCSLSADPGPCCNESLSQRFFYNSTSMKCERFIYGGCPGNANNFGSEEEGQGCCGELCLPLVFFDDHVDSLVNVLPLSSTAGCPYKGMRYYDISKGECAPCFGTCEEPNVPCLAICRSGCACPPGTVLHEGECIAVTECSNGESCDCHMFKVLHQRYFTGLCSICLLCNCIVINCHMTVTCHHVLSHYTRTSQHSRSTSGDVYRGLVLTHSLSSSLPPSLPPPLQSAKSKDRSTLMLSTRVFLVLVNVKSLK